MTADGSLAAHFEHTVAITDDGPWVLTAEDGGAGGFAALRSGQLARCGDRSRSGRPSSERQGVRDGV